MAGILAISFFPMVAIIAPLFIEFHKLGLIDTYVAVILTDTVFALPLAVWILAAFFRQLPADLEHAAKVDGATTLQTFRLVILPLAAPGVFTAAILTFIATWNEFLFAITFLISPEQVARHRSDSELHAVPPRARLRRPGRRRAGGDDSDAPVRARVPASNRLRPDSRGSGRMIVAVRRAGTLAAGSAGVWPRECPSQHQPQSFQGAKRCPT